MRDDKDRKTARIITVWITKYALSRGIIKTTTRMCDGKMIAFRLNDKDVKFLRQPGCWLRGSHHLKSA